MAHTERLGQLRENLIEYFSQEELRSLCFDLGADWDRLRGEEKAGYVPEKMAAYGVSRPQLMTYDVQWRATYFLSISLPLAPTAF